GVRVLPPLGYIDFASLMKGARVIVSDSGGIQEEAVVLGVPCLTLRENTERPITLEYGYNRLVKSETAAILDAIREALAADTISAARPPLWDGHAAERTVAVLAEVLG
ncbi:MAG TPA: UDP-N-acetylglucosamine 2-epimerase, partial [Planctomycetota bacterium]|nr:UDP-N-acetylglucosamine 2-epimerase [Planctomycetota bacterium]